MQVLGVNKAEVMSALPTWTTWLCSIPLPQRAPRSGSCNSSDYSEVHMSEARAHVWKGVATLSFSVSFLNESNAMQDIILTAHTV